MSLSVRRLCVECLPISSISNIVYPILGRHQMSQGGLSLFFVYQVSPEADITCINNHINFIKLKSSWLHTYKHSYV